MSRATSGSRRGLWVVGLCCAALLVLLRARSGSEGAGDVRPDGAPSESTEEPRAVGIEAPRQTDAGGGRGARVVAVDHAAGERVDEGGAPLDVRSVTGLPLHVVEYRVGDGGWQVARGGASEGLAEGSHRIPRATQVSVRAPGHVEERLDGRERSVALEPDALLEIAFPGLGALVTSFSVPAIPGAAAEAGRRSAWSAGIVEGDRFLLAADVERTRGILSTAEVDLALSCGPLVEVRGTVQLRTGMRARAQLDRIPSSGELLPLDVRIERSDRASEEARLTLWTVAAGSPPLERRYAYDWGAIVVERREIAWDGTVAGAVARVPELLVGDTYRASASDERTGAAGCTEFVHTGAPVAVVLRPGVSLAGTFESDAEELPRTARARWTWEGGAEDTPHRWLPASGELPIAGDGSWRLVLPRRGFPGRPPVDLAPPPVALVAFQVPGHRRASVRVELHGLHEADVGTVRLASLEPDLVLVDHQFVRDGALAWSPVVLADQTPRGSYEVGSARERADRSLAVYLTRSDAPSERGEHPLFHLLSGGSRHPQPVPSAPARALVLHGREGESGEHVSVAFELQDPGMPPTYRRVHSIEHAVEVRVEALPATVDGVVVGWEWRGALCALRKVRSGSEVGREEVIDCRAPEGATLWWTWLEGGSLTWPPVRSLRLGEGPARIAID